MQRFLAYAFCAASAAATLLTAGVSAYSSGQGTAVVRLQTATPGSPQGGHVNVTGMGLFGSVSATASVTTTYGGVVLGNNTATSGSAAGVTGTTTSPAGYGVHGSASNASGGVGGFFRATAPTGIAVWGDAPASSGATLAGYFTSSGTAGYGIFARNSSATGSTYGVYGQSSSPAGYGLYGSNTGGGWAGYFNAAVYVNGNLGVGVLTPTAKLDVNGIAKVVGFQVATGAGLGHYLRSDATGLGSWTAFPSSIPPSGTAGGDLSGSYPNPTLATLATSLAKVSGGSMFTNGTLVGIGTSTGIGTARFVVSQTTTGFGGMYVNTSSATGQPFYGYGQNGFAVSYHYLDGTDNNKWKLYNSGVRLTVQADGNVGIGTTTPDSKLHATSTTGNGMHGVTTSATDSGVWGQNTGTGYGVSGSANSSTATGVYGSNTGAGNGILGSASGNGYGVLGTSIGVQGRGVYGLSDNTGGSGIGVYGFSKGMNGTGVYGYVNGTGGSPIAVNGWCDSATGWAGYFTGNVRISSKLGIATSDPQAALSIGDTDSGINSGGDGVLSFLGNGQQSLDLRDGFARFGREMNAAVGIGFGGSGTGEQITSDRGAAGGNQYGLDFRAGSGGPSRMSITSSGNVGIGTRTPDVALRVIGTAKVDILEIAGGGDVAEKFVVRGGPTPGQVVEIDPEHPGDLRVCTKANSKLVAGVVSGANGLSAGMVLNPKTGEGERHAVALTGKVWVRCVGAEAIEPGDLLVSSDQRGLATKSTDSRETAGASIGKAMTSLKKGQSGLVLVLVSLR